MGPDEVWSSLAIVKLGVDALTPIVVLLFGVWIRKLALRLDARQWINQTTIEWRVKIYDRVAPRLNDVYCYCCYIGNWKELRPSDVIAAKRVLDKEMHLAEPLFSGELQEMYEEFVGRCFRTFAGMGKDPLLCANVDNHKRAHGADWNVEWDALFVPPSERTRREDVARAYKRLIGFFARELNLNLRTVVR